MSAINQANAIMQMINPFLNAFLGTSQARTAYYTSTTTTTSKPSSSNNTDKTDEKNVETKNEQPTSIFNVEETKATSESEAPVESQKQAVNTPAKAPEKTLLNSDSISNLKNFGSVAKGFVENFKIALSEPQIKTLENNTLANAPKPEEKTGLEPESKFLGKKPEDIVKEIIENFESESPEFQKDVLGKYNIMIDIAKANNQPLSDETISIRLNNYAQAWKFQKFRHDAISDPNSNSEFQSKASEAKNMDELSKAYQQLGTEYVEYYDQDGNGLIGAHEMFYEELKAAYERQGFDKNTANAKALKAVNYFKEYNVNNLPDENDTIHNTAEMKVFLQVLTKIGVLDENKDGQLSSNESGAYLMNMAQIDSKNNIKPDEYNITEFAIQSQGMSLEEIKEEFHLETEVAKEVILTRQKLEDNLPVYQQFVKTGKIQQ